jgi:hypothetical protein
VRTLCAKALIAGLTDDRNNIERLTLAVISYLPIAVLYVHDLSEDCGTSLADQVHLSFTLHNLLLSLPNHMFCIPANEIVCSEPNALPAVHHIQAYQGTIR